MRHLTSPYRPPLALALQGGLSLGFFGWGLLEGLLLSNRVKLDALCGSSTGAINAVLVADGMAGGDETTALLKLETFWRRYAEMLLSGRHDSPARLRQLFDETIDFARLQRYSPVYLLVGASRVRDGHQRVFRSHEMSADVLCACISLPLEQAPVSIDGELYWGGGYGINLPLRQLVMETRADDVLLLQEDAQDEQALPPNGPGLARLISQRGQAAALQREIEAINEIVDICIDEGLSHSRRSRKLQRLRLHQISHDAPRPEAAVEAIGGLGLDQLLRQRELGRQAAEQWLAQRPQARTPPRQPLAGVDRRQLAHA